MNRILIAAFTVALLCGGLAAQSLQPPSSKSTPLQQAPSARADGVSLVIDPGHTRH